jgi:leader peptidase (prepilin peptidase)/N-methyltransferase
MEFLAYLCIALALLSLLWMGWIDLKLWILPNELVAVLAVTALPFHFAMDWIYGGWLFFIIGGLLGGGVLYAIRAAGNKIYGFETLGLGDIKLMTAGGLWLGPEMVLIALSLGAFMGVGHAIFLAVKNKQSLNRMMLPAGPGFIAGIFFTALWTYKDIIL